VFREVLRQRTVEVKVDWLYVAHRPT